MRIAIYHPWIYLKSGLERTILEICRRSRHSWTIYTSHFDAAGTYPELSEMNVVELPRVSVNRRYGAVINAAARIATTRLEGDHDVLVISCDGLGSLINFRNHTKPSVCLCFTPLRAVYDEEASSLAHPPGGAFAGNTDGEEKPDRAKNDIGHPHGQSGSHHLSLSQLLSSQEQ